MELNLARTDKSELDGGTGATTKATAQPLVILGSAGPLVILNNAVLLVTTVLGAFATLYADLFPSSTLGQQKLALACGWLLSVFLVLLSLSFNDAAPKTSLIKRLKWSVATMFSNVAYGFLVLFMTAAGAFCLYGKIGKAPDEGGVLKGLVSSADRIEKIALETRGLSQRAAIASESVDRKADTIINQTSRIANTLDKPLNSRELLAKEGVAWDSKSFTNALMSGDNKVIALFLKGGFNPHAAEPPPGNDGSGLAYFVRNGLATDLEATVETFRLLSTKIDLNKTKSRLNSSNPMTFATIAVEFCRLPMAKALVAAGVNIRRLDSFEYPDTFGGRPYVSNPVKTLEMWKKTSVHFDAVCNEADRQELLRMTAGATFNSSR